MFSFSRNSGIATVIYIIIVCVVVGVGATLITKKNDTTAEQLAEKVLKDETGIDIDFSPDDNNER